MNRNSCSQSSSVSLSLPTLSTPAHWLATAVLLITILIITGLVIDLGGGPKHDRLGFRVSLLSFDNTRQRRTRAGIVAGEKLLKISTQYWKNPGPLNGAGLVPQHKSLDQFLGILSVIVQAAFSFQGMELVAMYVSAFVSSRVKHLIPFQCRL